MSTCPEGKLCENEHTIRIFQLSGKQGWKLINTKQLFIKKEEQSASGVREEETGMVTGDTTNTKHPPK